MIAWVAALVIVLVVLHGFEAKNVWLAWTCLIGIALGVVALIYTRLRAK